MEIMREIAWNFFSTRAFSARNWFLVDVDNAEGGRNLKNMFRKVRYGEGIIEDKIRTEAAR
jgi:hypothetical protein